MNFQVKNVVILLCSGLFLCVLWLFSSTEQNNLQKKEPLGERSFPKQAGASATGNAVESVGKAEILSKNFRPEKLESFQVEIPAKTGDSQATLKLEGSSAYGFFPEKAPTAPTAPKIKDSLQKSPKKVLPFALKKTHIIDLDRDGYGTAAPAGPDADDTDPTLHSFEDSIPQSWFRRKNIDPKRCWYVSPLRQNRPGQRGNPLQPWSSVTDLVDSLLPGDVVIYRGGIYTKARQRPENTPSGSVDNKIIHIAWPGERPIFVFPRSMTISAKQHLLYEDLVFSTPEVNDHGLIIEKSKDITLRGVEILGNRKNGLLVRSTKELEIIRCVFHGNREGSGIFLFTEKQGELKNVKISQNLIYDNGKFGIRIQGPASGLLISENLLRSNDLAGISLNEGPVESILEKNLIMDNHRAGITLDAGQKNLAFRGDIIRRNTVWTDPLAGATVSGNALKIALHKSDPGQISIRQNIFVSSTAPVLHLQGEFWATASQTGNALEFTDNILFCAHCKNKNLVQVQKESGSESLPLEKWQEDFSGAKENKVFDPGFRPSKMSLR